MKRVTPIEIGERFGRLTVAEFVGRRKVSHRASANFWRCECDCGGEVAAIQSARLTWSRGTRSCGCLQKEALSKISRKHGFRKHPLYMVWRAIKSRCLNPKNKAYKNYGGRGISICSDWIEDAGAFITWCLENGWEPGLEIDRRDVNGNYSPENCRFVDQVEQARNKRSNRMVTAFGETLTLAAWRDRPECIVSYDVLRVRLDEGWEPETAMTTPTKPVSKPKDQNVTMWGETRTIRQWSKDDRCLVGYGALRRRILEDDWDPESAMLTPPEILHTVFGETKTLRDWSEDDRCKVSYYTLKTRLNDKVKKGLWTMEQAISTPKGEKPINLQTLTA